MTRITLGSPVAGQLSSLTGLTDICDGTGRIIGQFYPVGIPGGTESLKDLSPYTDEEIEDLAKQEGGRPLADILRDLEAS